MYRQYIMHVLCLIPPFLLLLDCTYNYQFMHSQEYLPDLSFRREGFDYFKTKSARTMKKRLTA